MNCIQCILRNSLLNPVHRSKASLLTYQPAVLQKKYSSKTGHDPGRVKTGVLMLNMGGPSCLEEVEPFLTRLFTDKDIIPLPMQSKLGPMIAKRRAPSIAEKYREIGGGSPILSWTNRQGELMTAFLDKLSPDTAPHKHYVGFRYATPLTEDTLLQMEKDGVERCVAFSQYPQYSCATTGSSINCLQKYFKSRSDEAQMKWSFIDRWPTHPKLIECFADLVAKELKEIPSEDRKDVIILFTAHALPMKDYLLDSMVVSMENVVVSWDPMENLKRLGQNDLNSCILFQAVNNGDPYPTEVAATVLGVMEKLNFSHPYRLVWQSKVGPVAWLSPQTDDAIEALIKKGRRNIVLVPISFVNEHVETLHELDIEYGKDLAHKKGVKNFRRVPTPNDHPAFIEALASLVQSHLASGETCSPQLLLQCPLCTKETCHQTKQWLSSLSTSRLRI